MVTVIRRSEKPVRKRKAEAPQQFQVFGPAPPGTGNDAGHTTPVEVLGAPAIAAVPVVAKVLPSAWPFPTGTDPLDALAAAGADRVAQLMLWKQRIQNPEMSVQITAEDIKGLAECTKYLDIKPALLIWRRPAIEAQPGQPATARRRAVTPTPATPAAPFVTVRLVVQGTHDSFKPIENNEKDYDATVAAEKSRRAKQEILNTANGIRAMIMSPDFSTAAVNEFIDAAVALAAAP